MSATVIKLPRSQRRRSGEAEFLPAALEILEKPPSPVRMALILVISALVVVALVWSYVGRINIVAVAQGKLQPTGRVKVVQPIEPGRVREINAENGQRVEAGEVLIELDATEARADEAALTFSHSASRAEVLRRLAVVTRVDGKHADVPAIAWPPEVPATIRQREELVLAADLRQLDRTIASLFAQQRVKEAERTRLLDTVRSQRDLLATLQERVNMRSTLVERNSGTKASLIDATETLLTQQATLSTELGQLGEAEAAIALAEAELSKARDGFLADNLQKAAEAERQADDLGQRLTKARQRMRNMTVRAPITGTVQGSSVTTVGQVVTLGEELMRVVPSDSRLEIEAYVQNKDIGFVRSGQIVEIKVESLPFTRYGTVTGTVLRVAGDAIPEPDAQQVEGNPAKSNRSGGFTGGGQRTQNLVFPVVIRPNTAVMMADGSQVSLSSGMAVSVEINTGRRRILEYVFSPLVEVGMTAFHER